MSMSGYTAATDSGMRLERMDEAHMDWAFQVMPFLFTVFFLFFVLQCFQ